MLILTFYMGLEALKFPPLRVEIQSDIGGIEDYKQTLKIDIQNC